MASGSQERSCRGTKQLCLRWPGHSRFHLKPTKACIKLSQRNTSILSDNIHGEELDIFLTFQKKRYLTLCCTFFCRLCKAVLGKESLQVTPEKRADPPVDLMSAEKQPRANLTQEQLTQLLQVRFHAKSKQGTPWG